MEAATRPGREDLSSLSRALLNFARSRPGSEKGDFFSPFEARISVSFHSFRLIFGREIISRRVLEEWTLSLTHFIAKHSS